MSNTKDIHRPQDDIQRKVTEPHHVAIDQSTPAVAERDWRSERQELSDLNINREKLSDFLKTPEAANVDAAERELLLRQYKAMSDYAQALDERLSTKP